MYISILVWRNIAVIAALLIGGGLLWCAVLATGYIKTAATVVILAMLDDIEGAEIVARAFIGESEDGDDLEQ